MDFKTGEWNESYDNNGNVVFYPQEEVVRFISKHIKKRTGTDQFEIIRNLKKGLDLGCGMGRHVNFFDDMGLEGYGIDLSEVAIEKGRRWFCDIGKEALSHNLSVGNVESLPYEVNSFDFVVSHAVLDSMSFSFALKGVGEVARVIRQKGLFYFDVITDFEDKVYEVEVLEQLEQGTIQSYFNRKRINELLQGYFKIIDLKEILWKDADGNMTYRRNHVICEREQCKEI